MLYSLLPLLSSDQKESPHQITCVALGWIPCPPAKSMEIRGWQGWKLCSNHALLFWLYMDLFWQLLFSICFSPGPYFGFGNWKLIISDIILINGNSRRIQLWDDSACKGNRRKEPCQGHFWKESYGGSKNDWEKLQSWCPFSHGHWYAVSWSAHYKRSWLEGWNMWCRTKESDQKKGKKWSKREVGHPCFSSGSHRANSTEWDC